MPNPGGIINPATGMPSPPAGEFSLYILSLGIDSQRNPLERARRMVEVFNLSGYLEHLPKNNQNADKTLDEIQKTVLQVLDGLKEGNMRRMISGVSNSIRAPAC